VTPPAPASARPVLPPLWQATFDESTLDRLFVDLESATEVLSVQAKADPRAYAPADPLTLTTARERLTTRAVRGVQVRYRYDGHEWTDTVLCVPGGYRLVRMQVPDV
jgi:hypothetical protein